MYKEKSPDELRKLLKLPKDYRVEACITFGGYRKINKDIFLEILRETKEFCVEKESDDSFLEPVTSILVGKKRIWFIIEYGGARLSEFIHLACSFGSKMNFLVGSVGTLKKGIDLKGVLLPSYSYSTESSCHMYLRNNKDFKFYPDKKLLRKSIALLETNNKVYCGPTITCQAMLAETWEDIVNWSSQGFYGVEMEASTIFAVSTHFKVPSVTMLSLADNLIEKEAVSDESYAQRKEERENLKKEIFRAIVKIIFSKN
jgi:purine-nucleoside phosphorylase